MTTTFRAGKEDAELAAAKPRAASVMRRVIFLFMMLAYTEKWRVIDTVLHVGDSHELGT